MSVPTPPARIIERERARYSTNHLSFPTDAGPHGMLMVFRSYSFARARNGGLLRDAPAEVSTGDTILLPLPKNLTDVTNLNVQATQLGLTGESLATVLGELNNPNSLGGLSRAAYAAVVNQLPNGREVGSALSNFVFGTSGQTNDVPEQLAFLLRKTLDRSSLSRAADVGLGSAVNPKAALTFEGVNLKPHSLSWDLAVKNRRESDIVRNIFQTIKRNSLPEYIGVGTLGQQGGTVLSRALLRYPSMVDVFLMGVDSSYYFYYKTAMVQTVSINFSPSGNVVMEGGKPGVMSLDLQIMEADIHTAEDYGNDNSGGVTQGTLRGS
jgi:hypothetical protein